MKKVINVLTALFLLSGFLMVPGSAGAVSELDQYQTDHNSWNYIRTHQYSGQTFKPAKNRLNKVHVKLQGAGDTVYIQMTKAGENTLLLPGSPLAGTTVDADFKWYVFTFSDVAVSTSDTYALWVATFGNSKWSIHNTADELYPNGRAYKDCTTWVTTPSCVHSTLTADWTFKTFGYNTETPPPPAAPPAAPPVASSTTQKTEQSATLNPPVLISLSKNETNVDVPVKETITMSKAGVLELGGTAVAETEVNIALGDKSFPTNSDKEGKWKLTIELEDVKIGEYTVKGKTVKDGKASVEAEFFKLKVEELNTVNPNAEKIAGWFAGWNIFYTLIGVGILLLVLLLLALMARRHHKEKTEGKPEEKKAEEPKKETVVEEESETTEEPTIVKGKKSKNK